MKKKGVIQIQAVIIIAGILIAALSFALYYYTRPKPEEPKAEDVYIGAILPLTGPWEVTGKEALSGARLAVYEINENGGIKSLGGAHLRLVVADTGGTVADASSSFERLLSKYPQIVGAVGAWVSAFTMAIQPIAEKEEVSIFPASWAPPITEKGYKYTFRLCADAPYLMRSAFDQTLEVYKYIYEKDLKRVAVVTDDTAGIAFTMDPLIEYCEEAGIEVVYKEMFSPPLLDATPIVIKLREANPDMFFIGASAVDDCFMIVRKMKEMDVNVPIMGQGSGVMTHTFGETMGEYADGVLAWSDWNPIKGTEWLEEMYLEHFGVKIMPKDAGYHYAAVHIIARALEDCGTRSGKDVRDTIAKMDIRSPDPIAKIMYNHVKWDENGDLMDAQEWSTVIVQWQNGIPKTIYPIEIATAEILVTGQ